MNALTIPQQLEALQAVADNPNIDRADTHGLLCLMVRRLSGMTLARS
ncbi:hypothetical protein ACLUXI_02050 [Bifidobacterium apri]